MTHDTLESILTCTQTDCVELLTVPRSNANPEGDPNGPLDAWLKFDNPDDEETSHEANIFYEYGTGLFRVEWYHTAVGLVSSVHFNTYRQATDWLIAANYIDFTVLED